MMKSIALKYGLWFALFGVVASVVTATVSYQQSRILLAKSAERELATTTQLLSRKFTNDIAAIAKDVAFLSQIPSAKALFSADNAALAQQNIAEIFKQKLRLNQSYFQLRLIGANHYGREIVRVERSGAGLRVVESSELEEKSHYPYVFRSLRLPQGGSYISDVDVHSEQGVKLGQHQPTLKIASPVYVDDLAVGVVVVNLGLASLFSQLQADLPEEVKIYLANQEGDYLLHPDPDKQFGFYFGHRYLIQQDFPQLAGLFDDLMPRSYVQEASDEIGHQRAVSFIPVFYGAEQHSNMAVLGLASPLPSLRHIIDSLAGSMVKVSLGLSIAGLLTSLLFAKFLSQPIRNMVLAVKSFTHEQASNTDLLPRHRNDELGLLARSFEAMSLQINQQISELKRKEANLSYMANHDSLTGLPTRALFMEQLRKSIVKAAEQNNKLAVVFIDLDNFKQVNDSFGHEVGDRLLQEVSKVLHETIRVGDLLARFAGDEFLLALEDIAETQQADEVVNTVLRRLAKEVNLGLHIQPVYASVGISLYPDDGVEAQELIRKADHAMYKAKSNGRNQFSYYQLPSSSSLA
ncbi:diguanylate cyclase domain-containing protein [Agarivorans sp.]|uniref:diguanylate cyclase domain-containing protein n=1 Tax=Agarivorans sp. TaxID=1872412 RepID=UPI003D07CF36